MTEEQILELVRFHFEEGGIRDDGSCSEYFGTPENFIEFAQAIRRDALYEKGSMYSSVCDTVIEIVKEWMPDEVEVDTEEYNAGWNACIKYLKENLK